MPVLSQNRDRRSTLLVLLAPVVFALGCACPCKKQGDGWVSLINGENLDGWETVGNAHWYVKDGALIGEQGPNGAPGDLLTTADYDDFEFTVTYKIDWPANSGFWFRYQNPETAYQADVLEYKDPVAYSGTLYCPGKLFLGANEDPNLVHKTGWNTIHVKAQGTHLVIHLNDVKVVDVYDDTTDHGKIGMQVHAGDNFTDMRITVRRFMLREL